MTTMFDDEEPELSEIEIAASASAYSPASSAAERSERATSILDEIGRVEPDYRQGITDAAVLFVEDLQLRLEECRARRLVLFCSEKQLEWLETIYEKLNS